MTEEFDPAPGDLVGWSYQSPTDPHMKSSGQFRWHGTLDDVAVVARIADCGGRLFAVTLVDEP